MWASIKNILPAKLRSLGLKNALEFQELRQKWDDIIGEALNNSFLKKSQPIKIKDKILFVDCLNSVWVNELQMKEKDILEKLKKKIGGQEIEKIKFFS